MDWPSIEGIDIEEVRDRLAGDIELFASLLTGFCAEYDDLADGTKRLAQMPMPALAHRMHKLRGAAALLAARDLQRAAGEVESAARNNDAARARGALPSLCQAFAILRRAVAPVIEQFEANRWEPEEPANATADPAALSRLAELLRANNLAASEHFQALSAPLRASLGATSFKTLQAHIDGLRYAEAAKLISEQTTKKMLLDLVAGEAELLPAAANTAALARIQGIAVVELGHQAPASARELAQHHAAIAMQVLRHGQPASPTLIVSAGEVLVANGGSPAEQLLFELVRAADEHPCLSAVAVGAKEPDFADANRSSEAYFHVAGLDSRSPSTLQLRGNEVLRAILLLPK